MYRSISRLVLLGATLTLFGAQCISFNGGGGAEGSGGGVFKSVNRGQQWQQKVVIPTASGARNFGGADVISFAADPEDHLAIYVGTKENGMLYSYDGGEGWMQPKNISSGYVAAIAIDPRNKCVVYAAVANQILKSEDCSRTFQEVFRESLPNSFVASIAIYPKNPAIIYAATTQGIVVKSIDRGNSWASLADFRGRMLNLVVDPGNPNVVYVSIRERGVWKTEDGAHFRDLSELLKLIKNAKDVRQLIADPATPGALILASKNKLSRTTDGGTTWTALPIVSPESVEILTVGVNPKNSQDLYYGTATTFYRSVDGGARWSTEKLPTRRQSSAILIDPEKPEIIYLGVQEVKQ